MKGVHHKLWIAGAWEDSSDLKDLHSPYDEKKLGLVAYASAAQLEKALQASHDSFQKYRKVSRYARSRLLGAIACFIGEQKDEIIDVIAREAGKPLSLAEVEWNRAMTTFTFAAEEVKRFGGDIIPVDGDASGRSFDPAISYWVARGPILGITPFNFPVNLVAHKVAPALAAGCSILIKPAPQAPGGATILAKIFEKALSQINEAPGHRDFIPPATFQVVSCSNELSEKAVSDHRIQSVSFTGSTKVGWMIQSKAIGKKLTLELGGNAATIVHQDADLNRAAQRCVAGGFGYAGQSCISVQRIFVHREVAKQFEELLVNETKKVGVGDPLKKETLVGPVIDKNAAERISTWIEEAKSAGLKVLHGGSKSGNVISPTILSNVGVGANLDRLKIACEEVFAPVVVIDSYSEFSEAIDAVNRSRYGLQAGVFTDSVRLQKMAIENLDVGGVILNEVPTFRADPMPYGGVKESGLGREGLRFAMEEFSERKTVISWKE